MISTGGGGGGVEEKEGGHSGGIETGEGGVGSKDRGGDAEDGGGGCPSELARADGAEAGSGGGDRAADGDEGELDRADDIRSILLAERKKLLESKGKAAGATRDSPVPHETEDETVDGQRSAGAIGDGTTGASTSTNADATAGRDAADDELAELAGGAVAVEGSIEWTEAVAGNENGGPLKLSR